MNFADYTLFSLGLIGNEGYFSEGVLPTLLQCHGSYFACCAFQSLGSISKSSVSHVQKLWRWRPPHPHSQSSCARRFPKVVIPILRIRDPFCFWHWDSQGNVGNGTDNGQLFTRMSFNASDRLQSAVATGKPRMNTDDPLRYAHRSLVRPRHSAFCEIGTCLFEPNSACSDALIFKPWTVVPNRITSTAAKNLISGW